MKITIQVGQQIDGYTFRLQPKSRQWIIQNFSEVHPVASVFISFDNRKNFEEVHGSIWHQIITLLTGLSIEKIREIGGFSIIESKTGKEIYSSDIAHV
jgi:hypothetical protein